MAPSLVFDQLLGGPQRSQGWGPGRGEGRGVVGEAQCGSDKKAHESSMSGTETDQQSWDTSLISTLAFSDDEW